MALSLKHQQFIAEYLKCWNAAEAYRRVYPTVSAETSWVNGSNLLRNAKVAEAIQERIEENAMTADEVLARLAKHARGSMGDFIDVNPDGSSFTLDLSGAKEAEKLDLIRKVTRTVRRFGDTEIEETTIDLYDAQAALSLLGKHLDLFSDKLQIKLEKELKGALDALEKSVDSDTYAKVLAVLAGKISGAEATGD